MASVEDYRIPWKPLDLGPGIDTLLSERHKREEERRAEENAQTQREFAERNFRAQDAKNYREERAWKDMIAEREKADKERKQAAIPVLMAASKAYARQYGPENAAAMLNAQDNPYVHFAPQDFVPAPGAAPQEMPATPLTAAANMQGPPAPESQAPPAAAPEAPTMNIEGAPVPAPAAPMPPAAEVPTGDVHDVQPTPQMPEPYTPADVSATAGNELHAPGSEPVPAPAPQAPPPATPAQIQHVLMAQFLGGGKPFAIPSQTQGMGLGGKYDQMFNMLVDAGWPEDKAREKVFATNLEDTKETGREQRLANAITGRKDIANEHNLTAQEKKDQFAELQKQENARNAASNRAKVASSAPALKIDTGNRQDMSSLQRAFQNWKGTVQLTIDAKTQKRLDTILSNINSGNPMQQREAAESLVSVFKGGGQVTKASQDLLLHNLGGIVGNTETFIEHLKSGKYGERELSILKQAAQAAQDEERQKAATYLESAKETFGPGSGFEMLGGNVNHLVGGALRQFGHETPPIYEGEAPAVTLGSGQRPSAPKPKVSSADKAAIDWAHAHAKDPRAKKILELHGL